MKRLIENTKYFMRYNSLKLEKECEKRALLDELKTKIMEIKELNEEIKMYKQKNKELRLKIKELKENK